MAKIKYDGVVEAVHYDPNGLVDWVRVYQRHGVVFSDRVILKRQEFVERLKAGKRFLVGKRIAQMGASFDVSQPVNVIKRNGEEVLAVGDAQPEKDHLDGVPII